jgi:hypothetical protein
LQSAVTALGRVKSLHMWRPFVWTSSQNGHGVAKQTLADFERGARSPYPRTLADIREALEAEGVEFTNGDAPGVRLRQRK